MSPRARKLRLIRNTAVADDEPAEIIEDSAPQAPSGEIDALSDGALVTLAARGEKSARERLYRRHARFCLNLGARIAGSNSDVEDIVHDAFLKAFERLNTLRNPEQFRSWLGSIVVHTMRSRLRRQRLLRLFGLGQSGDWINLESIVAPTASPAARADLAQLYALLQTLPPNDRIAWSLRYIDGHDLKTTAALCRCSLATVKRRISRTKRFIQDHFVFTPSNEGSN